MTKERGTVLVVGLLVGLVAPAEAGLVDGTYWADDVVEPWSGQIQDYGGTLMDATTTWWLTGAPDADVNGNGYAWDEVDEDSVAGWRGNDPGAEFTVYFEIPIPDLAGDDVLIKGYRGSSYSASVWASSAGALFEQLGTIGGGQAGYFDEFWFDLAGTSFGEVQYVRLDRDANGPNTGGFVDAVGGVPEPTTALLLTCGGMFAIKRQRQRPQ